MHAALRDSIMDKIDAVSFKDTDRDVPPDVLAEQFMLYNQVNRIVGMQAELLTTTTSLIAPISVYHYQLHHNAMTMISNTATQSIPIISAVLNLTSPLTTNDSLMLILTLFASWIALNACLFPVRKYYFSKYAKPPEEFGLVFHK